MQIRAPPVRVKLLLNNSSTTSFEVDTGSYVSTIRLHDAHAAGAHIQPTRERALAYGGTNIELFGECNITVSFASKTKIHRFLVVASNQENLLGRDLCCAFNIKMFLPCDSNQINVIQQPVLEKYKNYLSSDFKACVSDTVSLHLSSTDTKTMFSRPRSVPVKLKENVTDELNRLCESGVLTKVYKSKYASPIVCVMKKNGNLRIVGDYSATVNQCLDPVNYPLPLIQEVITDMRNSTIFSKLDLQNAFLQLPLDADSKQYTTINTNNGLYQYNFLPFGLTASPGIFQSFLSKILNGINGAINYQDDILLHSPDRNHHDLLLDKVLNTLRGAGIKLNNSKCEFYVDRIEYLGHVFDRKGVHPNSEKIRAIIDAPAPRDTKQVMSFIGVCTYYAKFIKNFSSSFAPLYDLLKKNKKFQWTEEHERCFSRIKHLFQHHHVLKIFDPGKETMLECDSSGYGLGAVLFQRDSPNDMWMPIEFASRTLNPSEKNYSNLEREALSVIFGVTKFRRYLLGINFIIHNDQQPLRKLLAHNANVPLNCSARVQRWALKLTQFNYRFEYSKGVNNVNSDYLSRLPLPEMEKSCEPYEIIFAVSSLDTMPVTCDDIKSQTNASKDYCMLKHFIKFGWPQRLNNPNLKYFEGKINELSLFDGCILYKNRVFVPESLRKSVLCQLHENHPGICGMKAIARSLVWYPNIDHDIEQLVKSCGNCQTNASKPPKQNIEWPMPDKVWSRVHLDHFFLDNHVCLIAVDSLSRYIEVEIVRDTSSSETIDALHCIMSRNGLCNTVVTDNAACFHSQLFKDFLKCNGIIHITPPPFSPSSNGQAERGVKVIKDLMKKCKDNNSSFKTRLSRVLLQYRSVPHSITSIPPSISLNNRKYITRRDRINPHYCSAKNKPSKSITSYKVNDRVLCLNMSQGPKWVQGTIVEKLGVNVFNVHIHDLNVIWKRHSNQMLLRDISNSNDVNDKSNNDIADQNPISEHTRFGEFIPSNEADPTDPNQPSPLRRSERIRRPPVRYGYD